MFAKTLLKISLLHEPKSNFLSKPFYLLVSQGFYTHCSCFTLFSQM